MTSSAPRARVHFHSLGCAKNLLDTEVMLGTLATHGYALAESLDDADAVVVNTCSFIESAREESVQAILDGMGDAVVTVDGRDQVVLMNERARALFELAPGRAEGRPVLEVIRNAELHRIFRESRLVRAGGSDRRPGEAVIARERRLATPVERIVQVTAVPLRLPGDEYGVVMVLHDVTELRRLELVRTEFVANVSHELRTPLTALVAEASLLGEHLDRMPEAARRPAELLDLFCDDAEPSLLGDRPGLVEPRLPLCVERAGSAALRDGKGDEGGGLVVLPTELAVDLERPFALPRRLQRDSDLPCTTSTST